MMLVLLVHQYHQVVCAAIQELKIALYCPPELHVHTPALKDLATNEDQWTITFIDAS